MSLTVRYEWVCAWSRCSAVNGCGMARLVGRVQSTELLASMMILSALWPAARVALAASVVCRRALQW